MYTSVFVVFLLFICDVIGNDDENQAKLRFYSKTMENYTELYIDEADKIFSTSWYDPSKPFVVFTHGFTGYPKGPAVTAVITAYLEEDESNVALLNWERLASMIFPSLIQSYLQWAIPNAIQLGGDFAETLLKLSAAGLDLNNTHFVGHSLGAHIFGIAGNKLAEKGVRLPWITGLDPATGFEMKPPSLRLNSNSALFTAALHSDPHRYGSKRELGMVNFLPNYRGFGTIIQPGCPGGNAQRFSHEDFCSHNRAWQLWIDAMKYPGTILGSHARNFRTWNRYNKEEREENVLELGVFKKDAIPGSYFFKTSDKSPYGLGKDGL